MRKHYLQPRNSYCMCVCCLMCGFSEQAGQISNSYSLVQSLCPFLPFFSQILFAWCIPISLLQSLLCFPILVLLMYMEYKFSLINMIAVLIPSHHSHTIWFVLQGEVSPVDEHATLPYHLIRTTHNLTHINNQQPYTVKIHVEGFIFYLIREFAFSRAMRLGAQ